MKNIKIFLSVFIIMLCFGMFNVQEVKAYNFWGAKDVTTSDNEDEIRYFITELSFKTGNTLHIKGYAYSKARQTYYPDNHSYYLTLEGVNSGTTYVYSLTLVNQNLYLPISNITRVCGDREQWTNGKCIRHVYGGWFEQDINIEDVFNNPNDTDYRVWLGIREEWANNELKTLIQTFPQIIEKTDTTIYKNQKFDLQKSIYRDAWGNNTTGVRARKVASSSNTNMVWRTNEIGLSKPSSGRDNVYICAPSTCGQADSIFAYAGHATDEYGVYWLAAYGHGTNNVDWNYGGNKTMGSGGSVYFWEPTTYNHLLSEYVTIKRNKYSVATINQITTKTARNNESTTVTAQFHNSNEHGASPVSYSLCVYNDNNYNGTPTCTSGRTTNTGYTNVNVTVAGNGKNRKVVFNINEDYTNISKSLESVLYAASNESRSFSNSSGSYTIQTPIEVRRYYNNGNPTTTEYRETITYNNPQNYVLTNGDYNGASINRQTSLSYSDGGSGSGWGTLTHSGVGGNGTIKNYVSNPSAESNATSTLENANKISTNNTIYVAYRNLNNQAMKTTYKGVGVNNVTVVLNSAYRFDNLSKIEYIDSYTTEKTDTANVTTSIKNSGNRNLKWYIYYNGNLVKSNQEAWDNSKIFNINDYIIPENGTIEVKIIEPNGVVSSLKGQTYVASGGNITLTEGETYTPTTPVRVYTTPTSIKKYFETFSINSINTSLNINAGEGFENKLRINYSTESGNIPLNNNEISIVTTFPEQEYDLDFTETSDGVFVPLQSTSSSATENIFELPQMVVEKKEGTIYRKNDPRTSGLTVLDGGRRWYTKLTAENGKYDFYNSISHVGVNAINIKFYNEYHINGSLLGNPDSTFKVIRVQNPSNPNYTYHKTYSLSELLKEFNIEITE